MLRHSDPWTTIQPGFRPWSWVPFCLREQRRSWPCPGPLTLHWTSILRVRVLAGCTGLIPGPLVPTAAPSTALAGQEVTPRPPIPGSPAPPPPERTVSAHRAQCLACIVSRLIT